MSTQLHQGYVTIAMGVQKYVEMALVLALSLKIFDPKRPVCLLYDENVRLPPYSDKVFDRVISVKDDRRYVGCMNKLRLYEYSPFDQTMFIDADCILMKADIDAYWAHCAGRNFALPGSGQSGGYWQNLDIAATCERFDCPQIVVMNSGTLYFEKGFIAESMFKEVNWLYCNHRSQLSQFHRNQPGQYADEPFFGVAMGRLGLEPIGIDERVGSWMVTTWRARRCSFDIDAGICSLEKPSAFWWPAQARFAKGWIRHSPVLVHLIGLRPRRAYQKLADQLRTRHAHRLL